MQGLVNFSSDYGSRAASFSPMAKTDGWSRKPQPLLKLHMHKVSCSWTHHSDYAIYLFIYFLGGGGGGQSLYLAIFWAMTIISIYCVL